MCTLTRFGLLLFRWGVILDFAHHCRIVWGHWSFGGRRSGGGRLFIGGDFRGWRRNSGGRQASGGRWCSDRPRGFHIVDCTRTRTRTRTSTRTWTSICTMEKVKIFPWLLVVAIYVHILRGFFKKKDPKNIFLKMHLAQAPWSRSL